MTLNGEGSTVEVGEIQRYQRLVRVLATIIDDVGALADDPDYLTADQRGLLAASLRED